MLPEDEEAVVTAVENFRDAYIAYDGGTYNSSSAPDYQLGFGVALLEATFNANFPNTSGSYYATYDSSSTASFTLQTFEDENGNVMIDEADLLEPFDDLLNLFGNESDIAPVSDIIVVDDVQANGTVQISFTLSRLLSGLGQTGIGSKSYLAHDTTDCNGNGYYNAAERIYFSIGSPALAYPWYYNVTKYHCTDKNHDATMGAFDYNVYYWGPTNTGHLRPHLLEVNNNYLTGYQDNFLGGPYWTGEPGAREWMPNDCVTNNEMYDYRDGALAVLTDFTDFTGHGFLQHKVYTVYRINPRKGIGAVFHGMEWVSPTGATSVLQPL